MIDAYNLDEPVDNDTRATRALAPDLIVTPTEVYTDALLLIDAAGRSGGIVPRDSADPALGVEPLPRRALLPGFVNAHSHVFQRLLRGHTHHGSGGRDSFWTWRERMYAEAGRLTPESLYAVARSCYGEMLRAGYTTVGEFHYVHHAPDGQPYDDALVMVRALVAAASDTGIRLALLPVAYARGGFDRPADPGQRRFLFPTVDAYLDFVESARSILGDARHTLGVAPHSVRAVPVEWLAPIARYARDHGLVLHIHASEQPTEVDETCGAYGCTPIGLLARHDALGRATTLVHATHATAEDCALIAAAGTRVCVCPTTEGDLGDGIAPYELFIENGIPLSIGSDGQTRIDPYEELRWAEFSARMRYGRRRVLASGHASPGALLLAAGTVGGAESLGVAAGSLERGRWADAVAVDLDHSSLHGATPADLRDTLIFGAGSEVVAAVWVGGALIRP